MCFFYVFLVWYNVTILNSGFQGGFPVTVGSLTSISLIGSNFGYVCTTNDDIPWNNVIHTGAWATISGAGQLITVNVNGVYAISIQNQFNLTVVGGENMYGAALKINGSYAYPGPTIYADTYPVGVSFNSILNLTAGTILSTEIFIVEGTSTITITPVNGGNTFSVFLLAAV